MKEESKKELLHLKTKEERKKYLWKKCKGIFIIISFCIDVLESKMFFSVGYVWYKIVCQSFVKKYCSKVAENLEPLTLKNGESKMIKFNGTSSIDKELDEDENIINNEKEVMKENKSEEKKDIKLHHEELGHCIENFQSHSKLALTQLNNVVDYLRSKEDENALESFKGEIEILGDVSYFSSYSLFLFISLVFVLNFLDIIY